MRTLKKAFNFILTLALLYGIYLIWTNQEKIAAIGYNLINAHRKVVIEEANEYKRYYNYDNFDLNENYEPNSKEDLLNIMFNYLNNGWNEFTFYCSNEYESCMQDIKDISEDSTLLSSINNYVSPYNSFTHIYTMLTTDKSITLTKISTYSDAFIDEINAEIEKIISNLKLDGLSNRKKIKRIHDYLIKNVEYDKNEEAGNTTSANAYGPLFEGKAICSGYADAMALFLDKLEIPNFKLASENHVWNIVYLNNKWLHLDVTWDDPINAITQDIDDTYFLITTDKLLSLDSEEHSINYELYKEMKISES